MTAPISPFNAICAYRLIQANSRQTSPITSTIAPYRDYDPGWSDERIALQLNVPRDEVTKIRLDHFPDWVKTLTPPPPLTLTDLHHEVLTELIRRMGNSPDKHIRLDDLWVKLNSPR